MLTPPLSHPFWGNITDSRGDGYVSAINFTHNSFRNKPFPVYLGNHDIEYTPNEQKQHPELKYKPLDTIFGPQLQLLDELAATYQDFIDNIESNLQSLFKASFRFYQEFLDEQYGGEDKIHTLEAHNDHLSDLASIRVNAGKEIILIFYYDLISAPVHYAIFANGKLDNIHGQQIPEDWQ